MRDTRMLDLAGQIGHWGYRQPLGLWAHLPTPGGTVSLGDCEPGLPHLGALAVALDSDEVCADLGASLDDILSALEHGWVPVPGEPTWTTWHIARRDAARHLVAHHGMTVAAAAHYCRAWADDVPPLPVRDRTRDEEGRWWITEDGVLARSYGYCEVSAASLEVLRPAQRTYCLYFLPGLSQVGRETTMWQMRWWTPTDPDTVVEVLARWGEDPGLCQWVDSHLGDFF